ncbi:carboxypeptidase M32 [Peredibacter sp. HCB2-198]|uniref:carboxypeptidase M32 n=1 Tax=Peredibacter sp. HCB2-198 TaxID=3383025 RepID=UPI0038B5F6B8
MSTKKVQEYLKEVSYLKSIQALLHWDMETMMPKGAVEDRAEHLSYIGSKIHSQITSKQYASLLKEMEGMRLKPREKKLLKELKWDYDLFHALPEKHVVELSKAQTMATHAWAEARKKNDWSAFKPHLQKLIDLKKREATFYKTKTPYDALIRLHDKEFSSAEIDRLFGDLKKGLLKLSHAVEKDKTFVKVKGLKGPFDIDAQKKLSAYAVQLCGLPASHSRLDESVHPFSINISPLDQRITTRYTTENLDSLSSTMHEVGHALYEHNLPREWAGTPFQEAISLSVHESQSRFWENVVGRSRAFCHFIHPKMKELFPTAMKGVSEEALYHIFNKSVPGMIRVEECELYYNFHIIIRYEIEEMIFNQGLKAADIPAIWNEKYKEYLGLTPKTYAEGLMQDSHWAGGAFGYFPTYTLGNLISGTIYQKMKKDMPNFKKDVGNGKLGKIGEYLKENIHSKGRSVDAKDIVGKLDVKDYLNYLTEKFEV